MFSFVRVLNSRPCCFTRQGEFKSSDGQRDQFVPVRPESLPWPFGVGKKITGFIRSRSLINMKSKNKRPEAQRGEVAQSCTVNK